MFIKFCLAEKVRILSQFLIGGFYKRSFSSLTFAAQLNRREINVGQVLLNLIIKHIRILHDLCRSLVLSRNYFLVASKAGVIKKKTSLNCPTLLRSLFTGVNKYREDTSFRKHVGETDPLAL